MSGRHRVVPLVVEAYPSVIPFLGDWVYGEKTPPMPGHPDWTVTPAGR
ncbi:MAG TPA: hypothetical protein VFL03_16100 [Candidatus Limnocylindrales bacterium]|nr:hypothetical protein [Candidatus Limnocylindrales bacterium]